MYTVNARPRGIIERRVYLPHERHQVGDVGLGGFDIGKMFKRMVTFKPSSFTFSNIMGSLGSVVSNVATAGLASVVAPKVFSAHATPMKQLGMGITAASAAVVGGMALGSTGIGSTLLSAAKTAGSSLLSAAKTVGSGAMSVLKTGSEVLGVGNKVMSAMGGGSGGMQAQQGGGGSTTYVIPTAMGPNIAPQPIVYDQNGVPQMVADGVYPSMNAAYYPTVQNPPMQQAGFADVGQMPMSPDMYGNYYDPSGGPVDAGLIQSGQVAMADGVLQPATIISGVPNSYVYIGAGVGAVALYLMLSD